MTGSSKIKVALIVLNDLGSGGAYNYESGVIKDLVLAEKSPFEFLIFAPHKLVGATKQRFPDLGVRPYRSGLITMFFLSLRSSLQGYKLLKTVGLRYGRLERSLVRENVSLAYFLAPNALVLDLVDTPTINTVWDLGHRDIPEFVEITGDRHFEERELFYRHALPKSFRVVVDTERTSERIQSIYGVLKDRVIIGGLAATRPSVPDTRSSYSSPFFLYPGQFWPHKRHVLLLEAFQIVCNQNPDCKLIFTGCDKGNLNHVMDVAKSLDIASRVEFKGFVDTSALAGLMKDAHCVVFPSQLGPSNLPPLEAAMLGTRSLISNVHFDPLLTHPLIRTVASQNAEVWAMEMLRTLAENKAEFDPLIQPKSDFTTQIGDALNVFQAHRNEWASVEAKRFQRG
jgi:glycosyltransferase involved in cell wall biosynthesis